MEASDAKQISQGKEPEMLQWSSDGDLPMHEGWICLSLCCVSFQL